ncbi:copper resistance protein NlpE N-terminal domain-containing protein [Edaphobacter albus]|uniref:copper resistance protein NlpE N-terminal domain-containing protein n=1 Tax=Edaphobacter sp. 4G125 TaxID=2763071 RepID=UPI0016471B8B|nr:copper resistance protein NlpE N-terminal domain-containing protein [Edaphobacter sp. 4G125]QNI36392.1 copper resistance protein NlpE N-terminal domain-containing protein [Edaphobacter sp. 4G125]
MRLFYAIVFAALICGAFAEAKTVTMGEADNHTSVALNQGDTLVVELPSTLPGQYRWVSHLAKGGALSPQGDSLIPARGENGNKGEGRQQFRYNAALVGETTLHLAFEIEKKQAGVVSVTSRFLVQVRVSSGAPAPGDAVLIGRYKGTLPCADCSGLDTELRLYAKSKFDMTDAFYVETSTYRATRNGDVSYSDRGLWTVLKGSAVDPNATVYQLNPDKPSEAQAYLLKQNGAALESLDRGLKPINTKMNLTLRRVQ